jgi:hypothetical protein
MVVVAYCYNVGCCVNLKSIVLRNWDRKRYVTVDFKDRVGRRTRYMNDCSDIGVRTDIGNIELKIVGEMCGERDEIMLFGLAKYFRV